MDKSGIKRAQSRLASLAKVIASDEFQDELSADKADWEATFGEPCPESIEELARWAARLGVDPNYILRGEWTEADLFPLIEGFLRRRKDALAAEIIGQEKQEEPPKEWEFDPGGARYKGVEIPINGIRWKLLKALVKARRAMTVNDLIEAGWPHDTDVEPGTVRNHLSAIRKLLRRKLDLDKKVDPIPCRGRGDLAVWELDVSLR